MDIKLIKDIERISATAESVEAGFAAILDRFAVAKPDCDLASLRALDVAADSARLEEWFRGLLATEPPSSDIVTVYFGLVEMKPAGTQDHLWTLYACGFVAGREPGPAPDWWPAGRYADSAVLRAVSELLPSWPEDVRLDAEFALVLGYALLIGRSLARTVGTPGFETFVGFDEGDLFKVN
ncbi:MAG: hypothetical protein WCO25_05090 [Candidatus Uhrbacteria bacterium]